MSKWPYRRVTPEFRKLADDAAKWARSPQGQAAMKRAVKVAHESTQYLRDAERDGIQHLSDLERMINP